jgi:hypothetical protein
MSQNQEPTLPETFRSNAESVIKMFHAEVDVSLSYDQQSVAWIDGYIERNRKTMDEKTIQWFVWALGAYLGESIIRVFGGEWKQINGIWGIAFDERNAAFPFAKVHKQIRNGHEGGDSVASFFNSIGGLFKFNKRESD